MKNKENLTEKATQFFMNLFGSAKSEKIQIVVATTLLITVSAFLLIYLIV
jgi:hypothetical protein